MFELVIVAYESLSCPQCGKMNLKMYTVIVTQKWCKTKEFVGPEGFF